MRSAQVDVANEALHDGVVNQFGLSVYLALGVEDTIQRHQHEHGVDVLGRLF